MKIAINANELTLKQNTGVKTYTQEIINALSKVDQTNNYILYINNHNRNKINHVSVSVSTNKNFKFKIIKSFFPFWTYTKLPREIKKDKPDILFMPIQSIPFIKKPKNIKIVVTVHDLAFMILPSYFTTKDKFFLKLHTQRAIQMSDKIITPSEATKKDIIKFYKINEDKIKVVYHGIKTSRQLQQTKNIKKNSEEKLQKLIYLYPYLLFVGSIQPRKNIIRLIEAFEKIKKKNKKYPNLKLVIVGSKGWMADGIYQKSQKSKFSKDIIFLGKTIDDELIKLYQNTLIFILPSLYEGFGLPILEAMSCGAPCVVGDNSSLREIANNHALLANVESSDDISEKINMLLVNDTLRENFSKQGLVYTRNFSWEKSAKQMLDIFENI